MLGALTAAGGCAPFLYDGGCGPESRETSVRGDVLDASGRRVADASVRLVEQRGAAPARSISIILMGPELRSGGAPLRTNVRAVWVEDAAGTVLHHFVLTPPPVYGDEVIGPSGSTIGDAAAFAAIRRTFVAGNAVVVIETGLVDMERLRAPLPLEYATRWDRPQCS